MRKLRIGWILALAVATGTLLSPRVLAAESMNATVTVTPVSDVTLILDTTFYVFGFIDVNSSTHTATPLHMTNTGDVSITVDKQITVESDPAGWTASTSSGTNTYVLSCATSSVRLELTDFSAATQFGAQGVVSPLTGPTGSQPILPPFGADASVDLWFRLDMPTAVSNVTSKTISVRFTGSAQ